MNYRRKEVVSKVFNQLIKEKKNYIYCDSLISLYEPENHQNVIKGKKSTQEVFNSFVKSLQIFTDMKVEKI